MREEIYERRWANDEKNLTQRHRGRREESERKRWRCSGKIRANAGHTEEKRQQGCHSPKGRLEAGATKMRKMAT